MNERQRTLKKFLAAFEAKEVLPSLKIEYQEVGFWYGLWLKITRQDPPIKSMPLPECKGGTITIKRPKEYRQKDVEIDFSKPETIPTLDCDALWEDAVRKMEADCRSNSGNKTD